MAVRSTRTGLPDLTGFMLRRAYAQATRDVRACIDDDIPVRDVALLAALAERGPLSQRQLADLTQVHPSVMVKLVDSLEERGWVVRERNPQDRRSYALRLTPAGGQALTRLRDDLDRGEQLFTDALTGSQRERLKAVLLNLLGDEGWPSIDVLSQYAGFLVAQAHRLVRGWALEELRPLKLDPRDFGVLSTIARDQPCTQNHLALALGVSPAAALMFVEELDRIGLVHRERNTDDRRSYDLRLTPAGQRRWTQARAAAARVQARVVDRLGAATDEELRLLLSQVLTD